MEKEIRTVGNITVYPDGRIESKTPIEFFTWNGRDAFKVKERYVFDLDSYHQCMWRTCDLDENKNVMYYVDDFIYAAYHSCAPYNLKLEHINGNVHDHSINNLKIKCK